MRSVMEHSFSRVPQVNIPRSRFDRSHGLKTTFDADYLIPIYWDEVIPGDTFRLNMQAFARLSTPTFPIMDNMFLETFFFFVPFRLVWDNSEKFFGAQDDPEDSIDYTVPPVAGGNFDVTAAGSELADYFGLPYTTSVDGTEISGLLFRSYNLIYNEWFRDQNLQDSATVITSDSAGAGISLYPLRKRGKRHDYFTACLPWPQKGDAVELPLTGTAPIAGLGVTAANVETSGSISIKDSVNTSAYVDWFQSGTDGIYVESDGSDNPDVRAVFDNATAVATINDLRLAMQSQRLLERDARSGTRYTEVIRAHYGVTVPDFRLQRPEFLGGGSSRINITPVANTSGIGTPGELSAFGTVAGSHGFTASFVEHGYIVGLCNVRADITYQRSLERHWSRSTRFDFYYPVLSQIGEQAVLNSEIYYTNSAADDLVFGYQERYAEYRYKQSNITGTFRSDHAQSLDAWHLSEDFGGVPALGSTFIESNAGVPLDRAVAVPTEPHFYADFYFDLKCARPMPVFGVPGNLDHF